MSMFLKIGPARARRLAVFILILAVGIWGSVLALQAKANSARRHIEAGMEFVHKGQPGPAEKEWLEAAKLTPNNPAIWELLAELYINTEQWNKGTQALQELLRTDPKRPQVYSRLAACALRSGQEKDAQQLALEELKRNPNDPASLTILAFLSDMQQDTEQQIAYLKRLQVIQPNDPQTLHDLGQAYYGSGKFFDLLPVADRLVAVRPSDMLGYALRGVARFETDASPGGTTQAEADLMQALKIEPLSPLVRYTLGRLYSRQKQYDKAIFQLEQAQKLYPDKADVYFELATAYSRSGQTAKATAARQRFEVLRQEATMANMLQKRCALDKNDFDAHLKLGLIRMRNGDTRQALSYLQRAVNLKPENVEAKAAYAQLLSRIKEETAPASP